MASRDDGVIDPQEPFGPRHEGARWRHFLDTTGAADARRARANAYWQRRQAEESASFTGVLVDLGESKERAVVTLSSGRRRVGFVEVVGTDVVQLATDDGRRVLLRRAGLVAVRTAPGGRSPVGDRIDRPTSTFHDLVSWLVGDEPDVHVWSGAYEARGRLVAVGLDVLAVQLEGPTGTGGTVEHLALGLVDELVVD